MQGVSSRQVARTATWPAAFVRSLESSPEGREFLERLGKRAGGSAAVAVEILGNGLEREVSALSRGLVDKTDCRLAVAAADLSKAPRRLAANDRFLVMLLLDGWTRRVIETTTGPRGPEPLFERVHVAGAIPPGADTWLAEKFPIYFEKAERVLARLSG